MRRKERIARHRAHTNEAVEIQEDDGDDSATSRRTLLGATAMGFASSLAGCGGQQTATEPGTEPVTDTVADTDSQTVADTDSEAPPHNYVVTNHTYTTSDINDYKTNGFAQACLPQRQFVPGQLVGFRVGVYDSVTGDILGNDTVDKVAIEFDGPTNFDTLELGWDGDNEEHPSDQWSQRLRNTADAEPDTYKFTVRVTNGAENIYDVGIATDQFVFLDSASVPTSTPTSSG